MESKPDVTRCWIPTVNNLSALLTNSYGFRRMVYVEYMPEIFTPYPKIDTDRLSTELARLINVRLVRDEIWQRRLAHYVGAAAAQASVWSLVARDQQAHEQGMSQFYRIAGKRGHMIGVASIEPRLYPQRHMLPLRPSELERLPGVAMTIPELRPEVQVLIDPSTDYNRKLLAASYEELVHLVRAEPSTGDQPWSLIPHKGQWRVLLEQALDLTGLVFVANGYYCTSSAFDEQLLRNQPLEESSLYADILAPYTIAYKEASRIIP